MSVILTDCEDSLTVPLTIINTYGQKIILEVSDSSTRRHQNHLLKALILTDGSGGDSQSNVRKVINANYPNNIITVSPTTDPNVARQLLRDQHIVIALGSNPTDVLNQLRTPLQDFINSGGGLIQLGWFSNVNLRGLDVFWGSHSGWGNSVNNITILDSLHPILQGVNLPLRGSYPAWTSYYTITKAGFKKIAQVPFWPRGAVLGTNTYGNGRAVLIGFNYNYVTTNAPFEHVLSNSIAWSRKAERQWLSIRPSTDSLASMDSIQIDITFKADSLINGTYYSYVHIDVDDSLQSRYTIPCTLEVKGKSSLSLSDESSCIQLDTVARRAESKKTLTVYNSGCDTLKIFSASLARSEFSVELSDSIVMPYDSTQLLLGFLSDTVGSFFDSLRIEYNHDTVTYCVKAFAEPSSHLILNADSIFTSLAEHNDSILFPLILTNIGDTALIIDSIRNQFQSSPAVSWVKGYQRSLQLLPDASDTIYLKFLSQTLVFADTHITSLFIFSNDPLVSIKQISCSLLRQGADE